MKKIAILTATRAEYGLLKNLILKFKKEPDFYTEVVVTGAHLSESCGLTYREIEKDGITVDYKIDMQVDNSSPEAVSKSMGRAMIGFADYFAESHPDALMVLGDRYETLAVCCAAMNAQIPIFHLHGGETTEGAIDEAVRHAITKMSYLHFTSMEEYRHRVIQLGEAPDRVYNFGAVGIENVLNEPKMSIEELSQNLDFDLSGKYALVTFHPVTLEADVVEQCQQVLDAIDSFIDIKFIITGANADCGGGVINAMLEQFASRHSNVYFTMSLGLKRYLSAMKYASFVLGNSSSGIIETPSFGIPTVNIGDRQRGRVHADSVIDCDTTKDSIVSAIKLALNDEFREKASRTKNPYGDGNTTFKILSVVKEYFAHDKIDLKKKFYDADFR